MKTSTIFRVFALIPILWLANSIALSQYSGTEYISDTSFFKSFSQAVDSIKSQGVNGMLTFQVMPGVYEERINIDHVLTTDESKQVTFKSYYGDSSQVVLTEECTQDSNFVIRLGEGCNYWNFEGITIKPEGDVYATAVFFDRYPQHIRFSNCKFAGEESSPGQALGYKTLVYSTSAFIDFLIFENNLFEYGSTALYLHGNNSDVIQGIVINNNIFSENGYRSILLHRPFNPAITNNYIKSYSDGIYSTTTHTGATITNNKIFSSKYGIYFGSSGWFSTPASIANNFIYLDENGDRGINLGGGNGEVEIYHNTVVANDDYLETYAIYFGSNSYNARYWVKNNVFACMNGGMPVYIYSNGEIAEMDYNCYYTPHRFFAYGGDFSWLFNLQDFVDETGFDQHSYMAYPYFQSEDDLHAKTSWFNGMGTPLPSITHDIDGEERNAETPDVGADEYVPGFPEKYAGVLTIGAGGDFSNLDDAVENLKLKGISDDVSIEFLDGEYLVKSRIPYFSGASAENTITVTSHSGDKQNVTLVHSEPTIDDNYILWIDGADFLTVKDLSFDVSENITYGRAIDFSGGSENISVIDNYFEGLENTNNRTTLSFLFGEGNYYRNFTIRNNNFNKSAHGIYFQFSLTNRPYPKEVVVDSNLFTDIGYSGIHVQWTNAPIIKNNNIDAGSRGVQVHSCTGGSQVLANNIMQDNGYGIFCSASDASDNGPGLIANNFVQVGGTNYAYGIDMANSDYYRVYHNTLKVTGTHTTRSQAMRSSYSNHLSVYNNIFANTGGGYSYFTEQSTIDDTDYNALYSSGDNLASLNGTVHANLTSVQGTGVELHSVSSNPNFISETDLHLADDELAELGLYIAEVPTDIDGEYRDLDHPSIGADEYGPIVNEAPVVVKPIPDMVMMVNSGVTDVALLDTVFNDPDPEDELIYSTEGNNASISVAVVLGVLKVEANADYLGSATIIVTATDLYSATAKDTFLVQVVGEENTPPIALNDTIATYQALVINVLDNDYDNDGDALSVIWVSTAQQGTANIHGTTAVYYDPAGYQSIYDTVRYAISDGEDYDTAFIFITITQMQEGFVYKPMEALVNISHASLAWGDYDADGDLDLLMTGWLGTHSDYIAKILNNVDGVLVDSEIDLPGVSPGSDKACAWTDFNNDGQLDFIITGAQNGLPTQQSTLLYVQNNGSFTLSDFDFHDVTSGSVDWGDFDNDGDYDLLINGNGGSSTYFGGVYINKVNESNGFEWNNFGMDGVWNSVGLWSDLDNDGDLDILNSGFESNTSVYRNDSMEFNIVSSGLNSTMGHSADIGDYDMDGDLDIVKVSTNDDTAYSCIYRSEIAAGEPPWHYSLLPNIKDVKAGTAVWGDYDNDGDLDLFISGTKVGFEVQTQMYENHGGSFWPYDTPIPETGRSAAAWADYDNDNDLDLLITGWGDDGPVSAVYKNNRLTLWPMAM